MRISERLGKTLRETLSSVTYREYNIWMAYFELEMNSPSRSDYYLMQLTRETFVHDMARKDAVKVNPVDFRLDFTPLSERSKKPKAEGVLPMKEYEEQIAKAQMMYRMGLTYDGKPLKKHKKRA